MKLVAERVYGPFEVQWMRETLYIKVLYSFYHSFICSSSLFCQKNQIKLTRLNIIIAYGPVVITWMFGLCSGVQDPSLVGMFMGAVLGWHVVRIALDYGFNSSSR